jgi:predicted dehydrogenase
MLLIGSGPMAVEYAKVLQAQNREFTVIGRGSSSGLAFEDKTGVEVILGGIKAAISESKIQKVESAIVAVGVEALYPSSMELLEFGVKKILIEKPGVLNPNQIYSLKNAAQTAGAEIYIAYNRRFLSSVRRAKEIIESDGGVTSFTFDFTEWGHEIESLQKAPGVKERWLLANSSHVLDLAFHIGGKPKKINAIQAGEIGWHPAGSIFLGSGVTEMDIPFSYHANWNAPGRWGLEFCTKNHKIILRPMEKLQIMRKGSVKIEEEVVDSSDEKLDNEFKPGLFNQVKAFESKDESKLCSINEFEKLLKVYVNIAGY